MKPLFSIALLALAALACIGQERYVNHGAITCHGRAYGCTTSNITERVQYWLHIQLWGNIAQKDDLRDVKPKDVLILSSQEPIVTRTDGHWEIRFN